MSTRHATGINKINISFYGNNISIYDKKKAWRRTIKTHKCIKPKDIKVPRTQVKLISLDLQ